MTSKPLCYIYLLVFLLVTITETSSQQNIYNFDFKKESIVAGAIITLGISYHFSSKNILPFSEQDILNLSSENINRFDFPAIDNWSPGKAKTSDWLQRLGYALPLSLYSFKPIRNNFGSVFILYAETISLNTLSTGITKTLSKRPRPFVYNDNTAIPLENKLSIGAQKSFFSGHTSNTAALSIMTAKIFSDYFPDSKWKYLVWSVSAAIPAATGYYRVKSGNHFPTDVVIGYIWGSLMGYFIPEIHKNKMGPLKLSAFASGLGVTGISLTWNL